MKKKYITLFTIVLVLLVAILTNPNQDRHKEVIKDKFNSYMQKSISENTSESDSNLELAGQFIDMLLGGALIDGIIANTLTTNNYVIFSTTNISWEGKSRVIGIGAFGNVFLTKKFNEAFNELLLTK